MKIQNTITRKGDRSLNKHVREFLMFPDVLIMLTLFLIVTGFTISHLNELTTWIAIAVGAIVYALSEYGIHRFVFHMKTPENPFLLKMIKRLHFDHHENQTDLHLLFLPLWFSIPSFAITVLLAYWITSNLVLTIAFATGLVGYFLFYEWKHFVAHKPLQPLTKLGKEIKKAHLWHHFKNENYWYGVTHTTIDKTFGTFKNQALVEKSETARNLEKRV